MAVLHIRRDQLPQGLETTGVVSRARSDHTRASSCRHVGLPPQSLREKAAAGEQERPYGLQEGQAEVAADLLAPAGDDDRGGRQRRRALVTLEEQTDDKFLREVIADVRSDVESGMVLSQALARHPKVFNRLFVAMVEAGESSGTLDTVLDRIAMQIEKETQLKRRVKGAMVYPAVVIIVRDARPHLHAALHRPGLRQGLRPAERPAADADAVSS